MSTTEVAARLGLTVPRIQAFIWDGRLPAQKVGRSYAIDEDDLALVADRKPGRPKKPDEDPLPAETPITAAEMEAGDVAKLPPARAMGKKANGAAKAKSAKKRTAKKGKDR